MIIRNGTIATPTKTFKADIEIEGSKIKRVKKSIPRKNKKEINANGLVILPGLIDSHVHFRDPPGKKVPENFYSGTASALSGGVTTIIDMPNNTPPQDNVHRFFDKKENARRRAVCDYAFHFGASFSNFAEAKKAGKDHAVASLKAYTSSTTGPLLLYQEESLQHHFASFNPKKPVSVHAEDEEAVHHLHEEYQEKFPKATVNIHNKIHPPSASAAGASLALSLAKKEKRKIHLCHISTQSEIALIKKAKKQGTKVSCEVAPHHLFLTEKHLHTLGNLGKTNPPLRSKNDVEATWHALKNGDIDIIASDHAPHELQEKRKNYWHAPSGVPGTETIMPLMLSAVNKHKITLNRVVQACCQKPAEIFNLKSKGEITQGKDADLVIIDLKKQHEIKADNLHSACNWTPFEGIKVQGKIEKVILRGKEAFDGENILLRHGDGKPAKTL
ncbi:MAG: dihydroorotase family protein [Candidatus Micrarchaeia archaeon]